SGFFGTSRTISLQSVLPTLLFPLTITGPGSGLLTVRRDPAAATSFGIFDMSILRPLTVNISGVTITGGSAPNDGGALRVPASSDTVTLQDVVITGNSAAAGGGGISLTAGNLTVRNSTISANIAGTNST